MYKAERTHDCSRVRWNEINCARDAWCCAGQILADLGNGILRASAATFRVHAALGCAVYFATICVSGAAGIANAASPPPASAPAFPLRTSANHRYLIDRDNTPFLMVGDSPQNLVAKLSLAEIMAYMANRHSYGVNTLWINLLCNDRMGCNQDATTFDGIAPFTTAHDLSTPNSIYFQRVDEIINIAAANGMVVLVDPIETIGWLDVLRANGTSKALAYGQYLGSRYRSFPNIIWMHGNDFQWRNADDDQLLQAVARGVRSTDRDHLQTVELNPPTSGSLDDPTWAPLIDLNAAYSYFPTYAQVLKEYNRPNPKPVFMAEANYEFEDIALTGGGSPQNLRRQEYWTMLSGATGQLYGSRYTWQLDAGWQTKLDSPGASQLRYMRDLFAGLRWYDLVPDQTHTAMIAGYSDVASKIGMLSAYIGGFNGPIARVADYVRKLTGFGSLTSNTYAPAARTSDGTQLVVYMPSTRTITVNLSSLAGRMRARWYDPTDGTNLDASDTPLANAGDLQFTPPGKNHAGDGDWVLVIESIATASGSAP
jgi:hypothetical protein